MKKLLLFATTVALTSASANTRELVLSCTGGDSPIVKVDFNKSLVTYVSSYGFSVRFSAEITPEFIVWHDSPTILYSINRYTGEMVRHHARLVSVSKLLESPESVGFKGRWPDSRRGRRCGRLRTDRNTIVIT